MTEPQNYSETLFLPKTDFPMRSKPEREEQIQQLWQYHQLNESVQKSNKSESKIILQDGPPYSNGNIHIGTAANKILKSIIVNASRMSGKNSAYVPGWDNHGLPIEYKVEEEYRSRGDEKDMVQVNDFRKDCREYASKWVTTQSEEFQQLGVFGDWNNPYLTMDFESEAIITEELHKFLMNGLLYQDKKPVMWSVVERTALAEAEVEHLEYESDTVVVKFPVKDSDTSVLIWTTTPWSLPGNRAIAYSPTISYGLYEVTDAPADNWAQPGNKYVISDKLAKDILKQAKVDLHQRLRDVTNEELIKTECDHPLKHLGYDFTVPMITGDHVNNEAGTGFVHTAPGIGPEDYAVWKQHESELQARGIDTKIPDTVDALCYYRADAPGFPQDTQVITAKGKKGEANKRVIEALADAGNIIARGRIKHQYPHSWRSKKPVIHRATPQWFIAMDKDIDAPGDTLRNRALQAINQVEFVPGSGRNRLKAMIESRPDWVLSRQRSWGVPIAIFAHRETGEPLRDETVNERIVEAFRHHGADVWFEDDARQVFLTGTDYDPDDYEKVEDILDVWFESGCVHAFVTETRTELQPNPDNGDKVIYLEGSDQHRGWFQSSLLESCGTRNRSPFDTVITHGFVVDKNGRKMSKSEGNIVAPQNIIKQHGADLLRLWVASGDYAEDQRISDEILRTNVDAYRKIRNTFRWMLGNLSHNQGGSVHLKEMPELDRLMLHRLYELDGRIRKAYSEYNFKHVVAMLTEFMASELSSFYFDVRKDSLYCDAPQYVYAESLEEPDKYPEKLVQSSMIRSSALQTIGQLFQHLVKWWAPILPHTADEAYQAWWPDCDSSVHFNSWPEVMKTWSDDDLAKKWQKVLQVRKAVLGALEMARNSKIIGSSLEACPVLYVTDPDLLEAASSVDMATVCVTSGMLWEDSTPPIDAFSISAVPGVSVAVRKADGTKCARSWKICRNLSGDPDYPDVSERDALVLRELAKNE